MGLTSSRWLNLTFAVQELGMSGRPATDYPRVLSALGAAK
jgi:hypothetical protein